MKIKRAWIYPLICFLFINLSNSKEIKYDEDQEDKKLVTQNIQKYKQLDNFNQNEVTDKIKIQDGSKDMSESKNRELKRRKGKSLSKMEKAKRKEYLKNKSKMKKLKKKQKKAMKDKKRLKSKNKKWRSKNDLKSEEADENYSESFSNLFDESEQSHPFDSSLLSESSETSDKENSDCDKKLWDSDMIEPEYVISEWFAILDGKKFDRKEGTKFPFVSERENKYNSEYLLDKKNNSRYLMNRYSSGYKYDQDDDDNVDYVRPVIVTQKELTNVSSDTREDEIENKILDEKFKKTVEPKVRIPIVKGTKARRWRRVAEGIYEPVDGYKQTPSHSTTIDTKPSEPQTENYSSVPEQVYNQSLDMDQTPETEDSSDYGTKKSVTGSYDLVHDFDESSSKLSDSKNRYNVDEDFIRDLQEDQSENAEEPNNLSDSQMKTSETVNKPEPLSSLEKDDNELDQDTLSDKLETENKDESQIFGQSESTQQPQDIFKTTEKLEKVEPTKQEQETPNPYVSEGYGDIDFSDEWDQRSKNSRFRNLTDDQIFERKRAKSLNKRNCRKKLIEMKRKYEKIIKDLKKRISQ